MTELDLPTKCVAVDNWRGDDHSGIYDDSVFDQFKKELSEYSHCASFIRADFNKALVNFQDHSIDLLHIDGFHTYDAAKNDFLSYKSKISQDHGILLLHDINEFQSNFGVHKLWSELKINYPSLEFSHGHGLGVIFLGDSKNEQYDVLFNKELSNEFQLFFKNLGAKIKNDFELVELESKITNLNSQLSTLEASFDALNQDKAEIVNKMRGMQNSISWKVTKPLRFLRRYD